MMLPRQQEETFMMSFRHACLKVLYHVFMISLSS